MSTRRRLPRQPANWPGSYHFDDDVDVDVDEGSCCVVDVSRMGAGIEIYGDAPADPIGRRLTVDVRGPAGGSIGIRMAGDVRNVALSGTGGVRMGVEFVGLSDMEQAILDSLEQMQVAW